MFILSKNEIRQTIFYDDRMEIMYPTCKRKNETIELSDIDELKFIYLDHGKSYLLINYSCDGNERRHAAAYSKNESKKIYEHVKATNEKVSFDIIKKGYFINNRDKMRYTKDT